ncbi:transmembrane protein 220 isoform X3 [Podarcis muralis]
MCAPEVDRAPLSTGGAGEGRVRERAMEAAAASLPGLKRESPPPPPPPPSAGASSRVWRLSNLVMAVFFGLAGAVQVGDGAALGVGGGREKCARSSLAVCGWAKVNDPDPGLWIVAYSVPAALTLVVGLSPPIADNIVWRSLSDLHSAACLVGSAILGYSLFTNAQKSILHEEEGRELFGLLIVTVWMSLCRRSANPRKSCSWVMWDPLEQRGSGAAGEIPWVGFTWPLQSSSPFPPL